MSEETPQVKLVSNFLDIALDAATGRFDTSLSVGRALTLFEQNGGYRTAIAPEKRAQILELATGEEAVKNLHQFIIGLIEKLS